MSSEKRQLEIRVLGEEESDKLRHLFKARKNSPGFIRVGKEGYLFYALSQPELEDICNLQFRPTDTLVVTFPRSGTTWTQEMVWLILNDLDYETAASISLLDRYVEMGAINKYTETNNQGIKTFVSDKPLSSEVLAKKSDPRFIKCHIPLSLQPANVLETAKVVYVARDPRDVVVSFFHLARLLKRAEYTGDFKSFWNLFKNDNILWTPYFCHVKEAWDLRNHPNLLFLFYEELQKDLPAVIRRTAEFFNKQYTEEEILKLCDHLDIKNFRHNKSVNVLEPDSNLVSGEQPFIRKGIVGGWREYFDEEMTKEADLWLAEKLKETGIRYPKYEE